MQVHIKVQELTGYDMFLFRPPYGDYDNAVINVEKNCGYFTIQWDVDSLDGKDCGVDSIIKTVTQYRHLGKGGIILCHKDAFYQGYTMNSDNFRAIVGKLYDTGDSQKMREALHGIFNLVQTERVIE